MKKLFTACCCMIAVYCNAQSFAINTTGAAAHNSAILDVTSTTKGLLVPRVSTAQRTAIASPARGLMVYDSTLNQFAYYDGTAWQLISTAANSWTVSGSNQYSAVSGNVGVGAAAPADKLHVVGNLRVEGGKIAVPNSSNSVYIGTNSGTGDNLGSVLGNTAIGTNSMVANVSGYSNTAVGYEAMRLNNVSGGAENTVVGAWAFRNNASGVDNAVLGAGAGMNNIIGSRNTFIGRFAGRHNAGSNNVFLGNRAGQDETGSDKLYISNSATVAPLIYGDFANHLLKVNGTLNVNDAYNLPTTAGTANQVLQTNGAGQASWVNASTLNITETDPQVSSTTANNIPKWNGTTLVDGIAFDNGTNIGIGTGTPLEKMHVSGGNMLADRGAATASTTRRMTIGGARSGAGNNFAELHFSNYDNNDGAVDYMGATISSQNTANTASGDLRFSTKDATLTEKMIITNTGNVGIGTSSPVAKLHVKGLTVIDSGRIEFNNTGNSIFIGKDAGLVDDRTTNDNVFIGFLSGVQSVSGISNVGVGGSTLTFIINGSNNTAIGAGALQASLGSNNTAIGRHAGAFSDFGNNNVFIGNNAGINETGNDKLYIDNSGTSTPLIYGDFAANVLTVNGNLGIGTTNPTQAKLVINGSQAQTFASYGYLNRTHPTGTINGNTTSNDYSIYATDRIAAPEFNAFSDARIKNKKGKTNNAEDLKTLAGIEITNYTLKDSIGKGSRPYKKVIAQQVEKVYPQAVSRLTDVVPDIYQQAEMKNGVINLATSLQAGEKVKLIFESGEEMATVTAATATSFTVNKNKTGKLFVYGREVSDFRSVDYEAISMLNVSATQELARQVQQQKELLAQQQQQIDQLIRELKNCKQPQPVSPGRAL
jgi:hypothetical protein